MMRSFYILALVSLLVGWNAPVSGQSPRVRVEGLEADSVYRELLQTEQRLRVEEDSLLSTIRRERELLARDTTDLSRRSQELIAQEQAVFDLRNRMGVVATRINAMEQDYILKNLFQPEPVSMSMSESVTNSLQTADLLDFPYFRENLTAEEYSQLVEGKTLAQEVERWVEAYRSAYQILTAAAEGYAVAQNPSEADSVYQIYRAAITRIGQIESRFKEAWTPHFNQEIYLYSYLLDKLNRTDALAALNEKARDRQVFDLDRVASVALAEYPEQRALLFDYQLALADGLNASAAAESLRRAQRSVQQEALDFPRVEIQQKEFISFASVSFPEGGSPYNTENPIPELTIPEAGTCYSVVVGTFSQRQAVSIFRGAAPVYFQRLPDGQWRYFVGLFRTYGDAEEAVQQLKEAGFRRPEPVRWQEGQYTNLTAEAAENEGLFRIEIPGIGGELPDQVREIVARSAPTKEITRVGDTFYIGTFTNRLHADDVMQALSILSNLTPTVEELPE
ncbi:MAG: hypothetical protein LBM20_00705 [Rikenellaceae bacterium]|jgi:hypothetical protein|nr:hypothetical protein [Rikenellaceae bacterium]